MKLMVTGGTGFVGSNIVEALLRELDPSKIALFIRDPNKLKDLEIEKINQTHLLQGDLVDFPSLKDAMSFNPDAIIHSAALVDDWASYAKLKEVNVEGTQNLIESVLADSPDSFLIHISSTGVYSRISSVISESTPLKPYDNYHLSKYESEQVILNACTNDNLSATILRPPSVMGLRDTTHMAKICQAIKNRKFPLINGGRAIQTWVGGEDLAKAAILVLKNHKIANQKIYNIKSFEITVKDLFNLASQKMGISIPPKKYNYYLAYIAGFISEIVGKIRRKPSTLNRYRVLKFGRDRLFDDSKIRSELGYRPSCTAEETITKTISWLIEKNII